LAIELEKLLRDVTNLVHASQQEVAIKPSSESTQKQQMSPLESVIASFDGNKERLEVFHKHGGAWSKIEMLPKKENIKSISSSNTLSHSLGVFQTSQQVLNQIHRIQQFILSYSVDIFEIYHCREQGLRSIYRCADLDKGCFMFELYFFQDIITLHESEGSGCELFMVMKFHEVS
jgi:hypothetical protein